MIIKHTLQLRLLKRAAYIAISRPLLKAAFALVSSAVVFTSPSFAANLLYRVSLDTTPLLSGPYYVDFQLNDGAAVGNGTNFATLSNFKFTGGASLGSASLFGGASGNLGTTVKLTDTGPFNEFFQAFTPGTSLSFDLDLTLNVEPTGAPDLFAFAVLDKNLANLATLSGGSDSFLQVNIDSTPTLDRYAASGINIAAPSITPVPEPSTYGLMASSLLVGLIVLHRRRIAQRTV